MAFADDYVYKEGKYWKLADGTGPYFCNFTTQQAYLVGSDGGVVTTSTARVFQNNEFYRASNGAGPVTVS